MQLRMLARRSISGSMTVVGDIGQSTAPGAAGTWDAVVTHLAPRKPPHDRRADRELPDPEGGARRRRRRARRRRAVAPPAATRANDRGRPGPARRRGGDARRRGRRRGAPGARRGRSGARRGPRARRASSTSVLARAARRVAGAGRPEVAAGRGARRASSSCSPPTTRTDSSSTRSSSSSPSRIAERGGPRGGAPTRRGLRSLYVAMTRPTRRLTVLGTPRSRPRRRGAGRRPNVARRSRRSTRKYRRGAGYPGGRPRQADEDRPRSSAHAGHRRHDLARLRGDVLLGPLRGPLHDPLARRDWPPGRHRPRHDPGRDLHAPARRVVVHDAVGGLAAGARPARARRSAGSWATFVSGALFLSNQLYEWTHITTRWNTNSYGSIFFITTGLHGAARVPRPRRDDVPRGPDERAAPRRPRELSNFQAVSYYWHFVDIVWIGLYSCLFLLK